MADKNLSRWAWREYQLAIDPRCDYCDKALTSESATVDHIIPLAVCRWSWAYRCFSNFALSCHGCNSKKGHRAPGEIGVSLPKRDRRVTKQVARQIAKAGNVESVRRFKDKMTDYAPPTESTQ